MQWDGSGMMSDEFKENLFSLVMAVILLFYIVFQAMSHTPV